MILQRGGNFHIAERAENVVSLCKGQLYIILKHKVNLFFTAGAACPCVCKKFSEKMKKMYDIFNKYLLLYTCKLPFVGIILYKKSEERGSVSDRFAAEPTEFFRCGFLKRIRR